MCSGFSCYWFATNIKSYAVFSTSSYKSKTHLVWLKTPYWEWFQGLLAKGIVTGPDKEVQPFLHPSHILFLSILPDT